jgi:pyridoxal phosphate enzyme (YggS family)
MSADLETFIINNIDVVKERIHQAARRSGRQDNEISLVAVTKQKSAGIIKTLADNGIRKIGESYLQEAVFKIDLLKEAEIEWHMIGNIQRGKEKQIVNRFDVIHSVSSKRLALELNRFAGTIKKILPIYLEINIGGETTKHGWQIPDEKNLNILLREIEQIKDCPNLNVQGLMTMAPYSTNPEDSRPHFKKIREIRDKVNQAMPNSGIIELSMGMSGDFEVAIEEGATVVRIGSALVGQR